MNSKRMKSTAQASPESIWVALFARALGPETTPDPDVFREVARIEQHSADTYILDYVPIATIEAELFGDIGQPAPPPQVDQWSMITAPVVFPSPATSLTPEVWRASTSDPQRAPRNAWEILSQLLDFFDRNRNVVLFATPESVRRVVDAVSAADEVGAMEVFVSVVVDFDSPRDAAETIQVAETRPAVRRALRTLIDALRILASSTSTAAGFARHRDLYNEWRVARSRSTPVNSLDANTQLKSTHSALLLSLALLRLSFMWFLDMAFDETTSRKTLQQLTNAVLALPNLIYNHQLTSMRQLRSFGISIRTVRDFYTNTLRWTTDSAVPLPEVYRDQLPITARANEPTFWTSRDLAKVVRERVEPVYVDDKHRMWGHARGSLARQYIETKMVDGHQSFLLWCYFPKSRGAAASAAVGTPAKGRQQTLPSVQGTSWYNHQGTVVKPETVTLYNTDKDMTPRGPPIVSFVPMQRLDETRLHSSPISAVYQCVTGEPAAGMLAYFKESQTL